MADLTKRQKELLKPWSELYARLHERLDRMSDADLRELYEAAQAVSSTNCWCMTFDVAKSLRPAAEEILGWRRHDAQRKEAAAQAAENVST